MEKTGATGGYSSRREKSLQQTFYHSLRPNKARLDESDLACTAATGETWWITLARNVWERSVRMRKPGLWFVIVLVAAVPASRGAEPDVETVRQKLDAAVASVVADRLAPAADDATYLRRIWIDLVGRTPPALIAVDFLGDKDPEKRAKMVGRLLDSEAFADHGGRVIAIWLTSERPIARGTYDGRVLHEFLREGLLRREPYDRVVRALLVGSGASDSSGPANFYLRHGADPARLAGAVGKNLLGVTIRCAQCHDHPFAPWKEDEFWGLAAAFARVRKAGGGGRR